MDEDCYKLDEDYELEIPDEVWEKAKRHFKVKDPEPMLRRLLEEELSKLEKLN